METLAAISLVGNIVQFVDFSSKLISKSVQLYESRDGALAENVDSERVTNDLVLLNNKLKGSANTTGDVALEALCKSCNAVADELIEALNKLKVTGKKEKWKSMGKAIQNAWSKEHIQGIEKRLANFREELNVRIVVDLRERVCQLKLEQSDRLKGLDETTKNILDAIVKQRDVFQVTLDMQATMIRTLHGDTISRIEDEHGITRTEIIQKIELLQQHENLAEQERRLDELYVDGAAFNSRLWEHEPQCLPETRVDLIQQIITWSEDPSAACIFWLNGMAGTGKSTIARTVARIFADQERLGASFFFSRGRGDLGHATKFFTSIAVQLATALPALKPYICRAMAENSNISQQGLGEQWKHLIFQPLSSLVGVSPQPRAFILVIDALDECEGEDDIQLILRLLSQAKTLKVFVTSRPETPIRFGFLDIPKNTHQDFLLHNISASVIEHDISIFFYHELGKIRKRRRLPEQWPGEHKIKLLVQRADRLFIYAATTCRFIQHRTSHPEHRLSLVLEGGIAGQSPTGQLDGMYTQVLRDSVIGGCEEQEKALLLEQFKQIVGPIVILFDVLTPNALAKLLCMADWMVDVTLDPLHSVLDVPEDQDSPVRLFHPSFRDFLLDQQRCSDSRFWIDEKKSHNNVFMSCLELMSKNLRKDICCLRLPGILATDVEKSKIDKYLPSHVQYACRYWVDHLQRGNGDLCDNGQVHTFLKNHFLHWLEALSLMGNMSDGVIMVRTLESIFTLKFKTKSLLLAMIYDAKRFILNYRSIIEQAPLQIYCSALVFSPGKSEIRSQSWDQAPCWVTNMSIVEEDWNPSLQVLEGHLSMVDVVAFSPDGQLLASGSYDRTVRLWDPTTGAPRGTLEGHSYIVSAVAFSPDGQLLASGSHDKTVRLWDPTTGALHDTLEGHSDIVSAVAFSPDGQLLASGSYDRTVRLWDPTSGASHGTLEGHSSIVNTVVFSPDSQLLASGSYDKTVRLWDPTTGASRGTLEGHSDKVSAVAFSPDGQLLTSGSYDRTVRLWDPTTGASRGTLEGHSDIVSAVAFSPDGQLLASGSYDETVRLWDLTTGASRDTLEGYSDIASAVAFSPDGQLLASGSYDETARLWNTTTGASHGTLTGHSDRVNAVAFSPDGQLLASGSYDETVRLWDPTTGASRGTLEGHSDIVNAVVFSPDGQLLASGSRDSTVRLWDPTIGASRGTLESHSDRVNAVAFSPDGQLLASGSYDWTVRLWDPTTGASRGTLEGRSGIVGAVVFSPDGQLLASGSYDKTVRLWDPTTGASRGTLEGHSDIASAVAFSPDGQLLASGSYDRTVKLWDPTTGVSRGTLEGHSDIVCTVAFSPDSQLLASGSHDRRVRLWDPTTGALHDTLEGHSDIVSVVAFSPDGQLLASGSYDGTVRLWDIKTKGTIQELNTNGVISKVSFTSDGLHLITDRGMIELGLPTLCGDRLHLNSSPCLYVGEYWVTYKKENVLWLHPDYRASCVSVRNNIVALGHSSGRVTFLKFRLNSIPLETQCS